MKTKKIQNITETISDFKLFLKQSKFIDVALGLVIATAVRDLCASLTQNIITPIIDRIFIAIGIDQVDSTTTIFGIKFQFTAFISDIITFIMILIITYLLLKAYILIEKDNPYENKDSQELIVMREILSEMKKSNK